MLFFIELCLFINVSYYFQICFRVGSVLSTVSVTLERFFAIVFPLRDVTCIKRWLIPMTTAFTVIYNFPKVNHRLLFIRINQREKYGEQFNDLWNLLLLFVVAHTTFNVIQWVKRTNISAFVKCFLKSTSNDYIAGNGNF